MNSRPAWATQQDPVSIYKLIFKNPKKNDNISNATAKLAVKN
jgi:hypothetical protein